MARAVSPVVDGRWSIMSKLASLLLLVLAGCPAKATHFMVVNVRSGDRPVADALVVVTCALPPVFARRADRAGVAELPVTDGLDARRCAVLAAQPGYRTAQAPAAAPCSPLAACQPLRIQLEALVAPSPVAPVSVPTGEGL